MQVMTSLGGCVPQPSSPGFCSPGTHVPPFHVCKTAEAARGQDGARRLGLMPHLAAGELWHLGQVLGLSSLVCRREAVGTEERQSPLLELARASRAVACARCPEPHSDD